MHYGTADTPETSWTMRSVRNNACLCPACRHCVVWLLCVEGFRERRSLCSCKEGCQEGQLSFGNSVSVISSSRTVGVWLQYQHPVQPLTLAHWGSMEVGLSHFLDPPWVWWKNWFGKDPFLTSLSSKPGVLLDAMAGILQQKGAFSILFLSIEQLHYM